jgi:hypothetical protein
MRHEAAANFVKYALSTLIIKRMWRRRVFWPGNRPKIFIAPNRPKIFVAGMGTGYCQLPPRRVFLRHRTTVITVPLEGWRRASIATVRRCDGWPAGPAPCRFLQPIPTSRDRRRRSIPRFAHESDKISKAVYQALPLCIVAAL